jgi:hypothetical protein
MRVYLPHTITIRNQGLTAGTPGDKEQLTQSERNHEPTINSFGSSGKRVLASTTLRLLSCIGFTNEETVWNILITYRIERQCSPPPVVQGGAGGPIQRLIQFVVLNQVPIIGDLKVRYFRMNHSFFKPILRMRIPHVRSRTTNTASGHSCVHEYGNRDSF